VVRVHQPQPDAGLPGSVDDVRRTTRNPREHGVEELLVHYLDSTRPERGSEAVCVPVHPFGDRLQPVGAVVDGVHGSDHGE
jgi:hypothetical protein